MWSFFMPNKNKEEDEDDINSKTQISYNSKTSSEEELGFFSKKLKKIKSKLSKIKCLSLIRLSFHLGGDFEKILTVLGIIGSLITGLGENLMLYALKNTVVDRQNRISSQISSELNSGTYSGKYNPFVIYNNMERRIVYIGLGMFITGFLSDTVWSYTGMLKFNKFKAKYFSTILTKEQEWFDKKENFFEYETKIQIQFEQIKTAIGEKSGLIIQMFVQFIGGIIFAFSFTWDVTFIMLTVVPLFIVFYILISWKMPINVEKGSYEKAGGIAEEMLHDIKTIASFANFKHETDNTDKHFDQIQKYETKKALRLGIIFGGANFFINFAFCIGILYMRRIYIKCKETCIGDPGENFFYCIYSIMFGIISMGSLISNLKIIQEANEASFEYFSLLEEKKDISNSGTEKPNKNEFNGKIEFKNVDFDYGFGDNKKEVFNNFNLLIEPGKKNILTGERGCGKSTVINLIERFYDPKNGEILIDGKNIKEYDLSSLRELIGYVQQDPVLLNMSIKDNIIFGRDDLVESLGDPQKLVEEACEKVNAKDFILKNKEKYDYVVGVKGSKLSESQKRKIAIARAILCKPKILLLDEPTSGLDPTTEKEIQRIIDDVGRGITTVIISNKSSDDGNANSHQINNGKNTVKKKNQSLHMKSGEYGEGFSETNNFKDTNDDGVNNDKDEEENPLVLLSDHKLDVFLADLGAIGEGVMIFIRIFIIAKAYGSYNVIKNGVYWGMMIFISAFVHGGLTFLKTWKFISIGAVITAKIRKEVLGKYLRIPVEYFEFSENTPGALIKKLTIDTCQLSYKIFNVFGELSSFFGFIIIGLIIDFSYWSQICLINLFFLLFIYACHNFIIQKRLEKDYDYRMTDISTGSFLSECINNIKTIRSFSFQEKAVDMYNSEFEILKQTLINESLLKGLTTGLAKFAVLVSFPTVLHYYYKHLLEHDWIKSGMAIDLLFTFDSTIYQFLIGISDILNIQKALHSAYSIVGRKTKINSSEEHNKGKKSAANLRGKIEFQNVTFAYPTKLDKKVLKDISFTIDPGQSVTLVGESGSGKSTIIQLIERFYEVSEGRILIDEVDIKEYNLIELRRKIGLIQQRETELSRYETIYEKILYGRIKADKEDVLTAQEYADLGEKDEIKPPLSKEEKQKLGIARLFVKNPSILLLDEPTGFLEQETEIAIQNAIESGLKKAKTSITATNKLKTIRDSDFIMFLEDGKLECGEHQELMRRNRRYAEFIGQ